MAAQPGSWSHLRQQLRGLETQTENHFHTLSQFASSTKVSPKPSEEETRTESQISELLDKRSLLLAQLTRVLDSEATQSAVKSSNLARHREILSQHRTELSRIKSQIAHTRDRANLLSNVREDIDQYRSQNPEAAEAEYMLDERRRIDNSHNVADGVLSQAYAINESFGMQRETLASINRRIVGAASQVPGINSLIGRIGSKKRRDGFILGGFIALCFLVMLYFT